MIKPLFGQLSSPAQAWNLILETVRGLSQSQSLSGLQSISAFLVQDGPFFRLPADCCDSDSSADVGLCQDIMAEIAIRLVPVAHDSGF